MADPLQMLVGIPARWIMPTVSIHQKVGSSEDILIQMGGITILTKENIQVVLLALVVMPVAAILSMLILGFVQVGS